MNKEFVKRFPFPAKIRKQWIRALKSGEYDQGRDLLLSRDGTESDKYCCLGVLGRVMNVPLQDLHVFGMLSNIPDRNKKCIRLITKYANPVVLEMSYSFEDIVAVLNDFINDETFGRDLIDALEIEYKRRNFDEIADLITEMTYPVYDEEFEDED